jgi:hypothetical protein
MAHPSLYPVLLFIGMPCAVLCVGTLSSVLLRTARLPICPSCRRARVHPAHRFSAFDKAMTAIHLFPFRCQSCLKRFYAFDARRRYVHHRPLEIAPDSCPRQ